MFIILLKIVTAISDAVKLSDGFGVSMNDFDENLRCIFIKVYAVGTYVYKNYVYTLC